MGYSEVLCHLCGVSFNIARVRTVTEPREAAWDTCGDPGAYFVETFDWHNRCTADDGCSVVIRSVRAPRRMDASHADQQDDAPEEAADEMDVDYVYQSGQDGEEPYEYESDDDLLQIEDDSSSLEEPEDHDSVYAEWLHDFTRRDRGPIKETFLPTSSLDSESYDLEHIAGPNCKHTGGYNGHRITAEQMRGCHTFQCLMRKERAWKPDPDDQDFELQSDYFLTGLSDSMQSRDMGWPEVSPPRHGVDSPQAENAFSKWDEPDDYAMPFHPWCFDTFTRLSRLHFGCVDINGLMAWWKLESDIIEFHEFPRDEAVRRGQDQWWEHEIGSEWLAANAVLVPGLPSLLKAAVQGDSSFSIQDTAFAPGTDRMEVADSNCTAGDTSRDVFCTLPQEIRMAIIDHLESQDIAVLRLSSRAFQHLPISLWYWLLRKEMPWLWEIWSDEPPSFWTVTTRKAIKTILDKDETTRKERDECLRDYRKVIQEEMPGLLDAWTAAEPALETTPWRPTVAPMLQPAYTRTNWYQLYSDIKTNWDDLPGLQNRRRIWKDVGEIIRRIQNHRREGRISPLD